MKKIRIRIPDRYHVTLGIPYDEEMVPFPNFGTVMIQHRRYLPDKNAFIWDDGPVFTFREWGDAVRTLSEELKSAGLNAGKPLLMKPENKPENILLFHALLDGGIPAVPVFDMFSEDSFPVALRKISGTFNQFPRIPGVLSLERIREIIRICPEISDTLKTPPVRLDHPALFLFFQDTWGEFCQYNLLCAAQSVGKKLALFREGETLWTRKIHDAPDWLFATLFSFYYGRTIRFSDSFNPAMTEKILSEKKVRTLVSDIALKEIQSPGHIPDDIQKDTVFLYRATRSGDVFRILPYPWKMFWTADVFAGSGFFLENGTAVCCKGMDFTLQGVKHEEISAGMEGKLQLTGHSFLHALWTEPGETVTAVIAELQTVPFRIRTTDAERKHFIILDEL